MTTQKAKNFLKDKGELAEICADEYPVKDSLIKGDTITVTDTLETFETISETVTVNDTVYITKTLPAKTIRQTKTVVDTIVKENTARVAQQAKVIDDFTRENENLRGRNQELAAKVEKLENRIRGKVLIPWWILLLIGAFVFRKQLFTIGRKLITKI